jgi:hypothetical protein
VEENGKGGHSLTKSPKTIDRPADNDRTNERPDKYAEQWLSKHVASNDAKHSTDCSCDL